MLMGVIGHIPDDATATITALVEALPSGSFLALYDGTATDQAFLDSRQDTTTPAPPLPSTPTNSAASSLAWTSAIPASCPYRTGAP